MATCTPFLLVPDVAKTIQWYEELGFVCVATNRIWEPDCELNWARVEWEGAGFMIGIDERNSISPMKDSSLWFNVEGIDTIIDTMNKKSIPVDIEPETFYGRRVVSFHDLNGYAVSFSCEVEKK